MKKIIFVINNLETGGVQSSLINLIKEIHNDYKITVLSFANKKSYEGKLPSNVQLVSVNSPYKYLGLAQGDMKKKPIGYICRALWATVAKCVGRPQTTRVMDLFQKKIKGYDCAIAYIHEAPTKSFYGGCNDFVLRNIDAKIKVSWLHCDFEQCGANNQHSQDIYPQFDRIVACSEGCKRSFLYCLPELKEKVFVIRNCNDYKSIKDKASSSFDYDRKYFNIVTVARLSEEKGINRAILAIGDCINEGLPVCYHIVGSGDQEGKLKEMVTNLRINDRVFFYGNQNNPYNYIKNADLFLLPSYHEAAPIVFDEAACLHVPVLATETTSTYEMLQKTGYGYVCENSQYGILFGLKSLILDQGKCARTREILNHVDFNNKKQVTDFAYFLMSDS